MRVTEVQDFIVCGALQRMRWRTSEYCKSFGGEKFDYGKQSRQRRVKKAKWSREKGGKSTIINNCSIFVEKSCARSSLLSDSCTGRAQSLLSARCVCARRRCRHFTGKSVIIFFDFRVTLGDRRARPLCHCYSRPLMSFISRIRATSAHADPDSSLQSDHARPCTSCARQKTHTHSHP